MEKHNKIIEEVEKMTVLELSELVKKIEEKFGVSATAPVMVAGGAGGGGEAVAEEKTAFNVELTSAGEQKIQVIKAIREATGLGLKEAKDIADAAPKVVKENLPKAEADDLKAKLEAAGAVVTLK